MRNLIVILQGVNAYHNGKKIWRIGAINMKYSQRLILKIFRQEKTLNVNNIFIKKL